MAAHQENIAKLPLKAQTGWSVWTDHPVRAFLTFLMARPPLLSQEGTMVTADVMTSECFGFSNWALAWSAPPTAH